MAIATGLLASCLLICVAVVEVHSRCMVDDDIGYRLGMTASIAPSCGKCVCIFSDGKFKWNCTNNPECEKVPLVLVCSLNGAEVHAGHSYQLPDGCTNCMCNVGGNITCTNNTCGPLQAQQVLPEQTQVKKCHYNNSVRNIGEIFFPDESRRCFRCSCLSSGNVSCTDTCFKCVYNGTKLNLGDVVPSTDGCNNCTCMEEARMACTERLCSTLQCTYKGHKYNIGDIFQKAKGDCNNCDCGIDLKVACHNRKCPHLPDMSRVLRADKAKRNNQTCLYKGKHYELGQVWEWVEGGSAGPYGVNTECDTCLCVRYPDRNVMSVRWLCTYKCMEKVQTPVEPTQQMPIWTMFSKLLYKIYSRSK